jgi:hypothetical protein
VRRSADLVGKLVRCLSDLAADANCSCSPHNAARCLVSNATWDILGKTQTQEEVNNQGRGEDKAEAEK